jgi:hypothetical protein
MGNEDFSDQVATVIHEITHALVFSPNLYKYYID